MIIPMFIPQFLHFGGGSSNNKPDKVGFLINSLLLMIVIAVFSILICLICMGMNWKIGEKYYRGEKVLILPLCLEGKIFWENSTLSLYRNYYVEFYHPRSSESQREYFSIRQLANPGSNCND